MLKVRNGGKFIFHLLNLDNNCAIITLCLRKEVTCLNKVQGIFDKSHIDGWDPNYKIYNEDIYALNFKKKKKNVSSEAVKKDDGNKNNDNA